MKKSSKSRKNTNSKKIREEIDKLFKEDNYDDACLLCEKLINISPKNPYGYTCLIKALTNNYNKFLKQDELKEVKNIYEKAYELSNKNDKITLKEVFDDYLYDIKEVDNLKKIKKDITSKEFLKNMYNDALTYINKNLNIALTYDKNGIKIKDGYDLINGIFLLFAFLYNIINPNYLLILTIPFGIFGIITIYSFIEMNFFKKGKYKLEKNIYQNMINESNEKVLTLKREIKTIEESIAFLEEQKLSSISKIPELFLSDIEEIACNDEKRIARQISDIFNSGDVVKFSFLLEDNTNLNVDEITEFISSKIKPKDDELSKYIDNKIIEKKNNQSEAILMKKVSKTDILSIVITLFISIFSLIILIKNFYEMNLTAFIFSIVVGIFSMLFYNINTGKHSSFNETFYDNLLSTIFNATLVYDLIYYNITNGLSITYGFLQIPITLILIFIGFVMLISLLKYKYLLKKLRS